MLTGEVVRLQRMTIFLVLMLIVPPLFTATEASAVLVSTAANPATAQRTAQTSSKMEEMARSPLAARGR